MWRALKWIGRITLVGLLLIVIALVIARLLWQEPPVSTLRSGSSEVLIFGRPQTLANSAVDGGFAVTLDDRHSIVLAGGGLTVNGVAHGRDFSSAHIRLRANGDLETVVHRLFGGGEQAP